MSNQKEKEKKDIVIKYKKINKIIQVKHTYDYDQNKNSKRISIRDKNSLNFKPKTLILTRKSRYLVFAVFSAINICINLDNGFIPAASKEIKEYLQIDDDIFGLYGSLAFFGSLIGI